MSEFYCFLFCFFFLFRHSCIEQSVYKLLEGKLLWYCLRQINLLDLKTRYTAEGNECWGYSVSSGQKIRFTFLKSCQWHVPNWHLNEICVSVYRKEFPLHAFVLFLGHFHSLYSNDNFISLSVSMFSPLSLNDEVVQEFLRKARKLDGRGKSITWPIIQQEHNS